MARIETLSFDPAPEGGAVQIVVDEATYVLPLAGVIDLAAEKARLTKAMDAAAKERDALSKRLENPAFVERAKPEARSEEHTSELQSLMRISYAVFCLKKK